MRNIYRESLQMIAGGKIHCADLFVVVVFRRQPEDRHGARFVRDLDGGNRLQYAEQRPAEEPHLLPRNHGRGACAQTLNVGQSLLPSAKLAVLPLQDRRYLLAPLLRILDLLDLILPPVLLERRPRIELPHFVEMMEIVVKKTRGMGDAREWKALRFQGLALRGLHRRIGRIETLLVAQNLVPSAAKIVKDACGKRPCRR